MRVAIVHSDLLASLSQSRLEEADCLLRNGHAAGAYYLAGYAVELAPKSRIARQFEADTIPDRKLVRDVFSHDLSHLASLTDLADELRRIRLNERDAGAWTTLVAWSPESRYRYTAIQDASLLVASARRMCAWMTHRA
jgi:hypothetical protein